MVYEFYLNKSVLKCSIELQANIHEIFKELVSVYNQSCFSASFKTAN